MPTVSCQERTSNRSFNIPSGPAVAVRQPTVSMLMTSLRLELQRPTATRLHLLTTPFRSTDTKAEDHWLGHWVPSSLSQQSLTWIMTICRVGGRGLRSWRICTGPKTAPLMMGMTVKTLNSGLTEWTPPTSDVLIPWGFVNWGLTLPDTQLLPTTTWSTDVNSSPSHGASLVLQDDLLMNTWWTLGLKPLPAFPKSLLSFLCLFPSLFLQTWALQGWEICHVTSLSVWKYVVGKKCCCMIKMTCL